MKNDPVETRMRELSWRRELTSAEQAELQAWLTAHPEALAEWENETELSVLLSRLPDVPVPSNFTARVLQAVERETAPRPAPTRTGWWHVLVPRMAVATLVLCGGLLTFQQHQIAQRKKMAQSLAALSNVESFSNPAVLEDFEAIRRLTPATAPDKELLALFQ